MQSSVIIPTRDRCLELQRAVKAVAEQQGAGVYEIIIVDDGSTDATWSWLVSFAASRLYVRLVRHTQSLGKSAARNSGILQATGLIIAFTDDDMVVAPDWLTTLMRSFADAAVIGAIGATSYVDDNQRHFFPERIIANPQARWPMSGNIAYRRQVLMQIGNFAPEFDQYQNEDTELALRASVHGQILTVPAARAVHCQRYWTAKQLLATAHNVRVWPVLYQRYRPELRQVTFPIPIWWRVVYPKDYVLLLGAPLVIPVLMVRYVWHGQTDWQLFFTKWPIWLLLRRWHIWQEAYRQRVFLV